LTFTAILTEYHGITPNFRNCHRVLIFHGLCRKFYECSKSRSKYCVTVQIGGNFLNSIRFLCFYCSCLILAIFSSWPLPHRSRMTNNRFPTPVRIWSRIPALGYGYNTYSAGYPGYGSYALYG